MARLPGGGVQHRRGRSRSEARRAVASVKRLSACRVVSSGAKMQIHPAALPLDFAFPIAVALDDTAVRWLTRRREPRGCCSPGI
jgi:hypothetical protein